MNEFETIINNILTDIFNNILQYEEMSLQNMSAASVTIRETHMLEAIGKQENATVSRIAAEMNIAVPTATVAIKKLERKGLIIKVPCKADGRRAIVSLTKQGKRIERAHRLFHHKMVQNLSTIFKEDEKNILIQAFTKIDNFFREKIEA